MQHDHAPAGTKEQLTREDAFILEKHSHDVLFMLLRQILAWDCIIKVSRSEQEKSERLLAEYFEIRSLLDGQ